MKTTNAIIHMITYSLILAACTNTVSVTMPPATQSSANPSPSTEATTTTDPIKTLLIDITTTTKLAFNPPVKSDIIWNEGDTSTNLSVYFGNALLIEYANSNREDELIVTDYLAQLGFKKIPFNESIGDNEHKIGYRKDNIVCKYDRSQYADESTPHLNIICADATKATKRH